MSFLDKDGILDGTFSIAGKSSAGKFNIIIKNNKFQEKKKNKLYQDFFNPDYDWEDNNSKVIQKIYSFEDFEKAQTPKQRTKIKKDIKKYFKEHIQKNFIKQENKSIKNKKNSYNFDKTLNNITFSPK